MGIADACSAGMSSARQYEELVCWQRVHELKIAIGKATLSRPASDDRHFRDEILDAATAAQRHIEEGFSRYKPLVFAAFLEFSRTAACHTRSLLRQGLVRGYFSAEHFDELDGLAVRGLQAVVGFQRYLRSPAAKPNGAWRYQRPYTARIASVQPSNAPNVSNDPTVSKDSNAQNDSNDSSAPNVSATGLSDI